MRVLAPIAAGLAIAGCGGPSADDYRDDANAICDRAKRQIAQIEEPTGPEGIADYIRELGRVGAASNDDFERLDPPDDLRADHERLLRLNARGAGTFDRLADRIEASDQPGVAAQRELRKLAPLIERSQRLNERLGLDECNQSLGPPGQSS